jgi:hypothetical protein
MLVSRRHQRSHNADRITSAQRILRRQAPPPACGGRVVTTSVRCSGQLFERLEVLPQEHRSLSVSPAVELIIASEMEAVQEWSRVDTHGVFRPPRANSRRVLGDVARDELRVEAQVFHPDDRVVETELLAERVDTLGDRSARALLVGVRPDQSGELLPRDAAVTGAREHGEQRHTTRLGRRSGQRALISAHAEGTERDDTQRHAKMMRSRQRLLMLTAGAATAIRPHATMSSRTTIIMDGSP